MPHDLAPEKVRSIYRLRTAVADMVRAELRWQAEPSARHREILLRGVLDADARTIEAISISLHCDHEPDREGLDAVGRAAEVIPRLRLASVEPCRLDVS